MRLELLSGAPKATRVHADEAGRLWAWGDGPPDVSHDGGATWERVPLPGVEPGDWIACRCIRAQGDRVIVVASDTFLSEDGGRSFERISRAHPLEVVAFASDDVVHGVACDYHSKADRYTSWFFRSDDGGRTFEQLLERDAMFDDVLALDENTALLIDGSVILRTEDGGRTFVQLPDVHARRFIGNVITICENEVRVSTDAGSSFRCMLRDTNAQPFDDACVAGDVVCAIRPRSLVLSRDGGKTARTIESPSRLRAVACARGSVIVAGDGGLARVLG